MAAPFSSQHCLPTPIVKVNARDHHTGAKLLVLLILTGVVQSPTPQCTEHYRAALGLSTLARAETFQAVFVRTIWSVPRDWGWGGDDGCVQLVGWWFGDIGFSVHGKWWWMRDVRYVHAQ